MVKPAPKPSTSKPTTGKSTTGTNNKGPRLYGKPTDKDKDKETDGQTAKTPEPVILTAQQLVLQLGQGGTIASEAQSKLIAMGPSALAALAAGLKHPAKMVRQGSANTLGKLGEKARPTATSLLNAIVKEEDGEVRQTLYDAVGAIGKGAHTAIKRALGKSGTVRRHRLLGLVKALGLDGAPLARYVGYLLRDGDEGVRLETVRALGTLGSDGKPQLEKALGDKSNKVVAEAKRLLAGGTAPVEEPVKVAKKAVEPEPKPQPEKVVAKPVRKETKKPKAKQLLSVNALIKLLTHKNAATRSSAATDLAKHRKAGLVAMDALIKCLRDEDGDVVFSAQRTLETLKAYGNAAQRMIIERAIDDLF